MHFIKRKKRQKYNQIACSITFYSASLNSQCFTISDAYDFRQYNSIVQKMTSILYAKNIYEHLSNFLMYYDFKNTVSVLCSN